MMQRGLIESSDTEKKQVLRGHWEQLHLPQQIYPSVPRKRLHIQDKVYIRDYKPFSTSIPLTFCPLVTIQPTVHLLPFPH